MSDNEKKLRGTVKFFNSQKGFGFIVPAVSSGKDVFVHMSNINGGALNEGDEVEYIIGNGPKGVEAKDVTLV